MNVFLLSFFYVALFPDPPNCKESFPPLNSYAFGSPNGRIWYFSPLFKLLWMSFLSL